MNEPPVICTLVDSMSPNTDNQICIGYRHQFDIVNEKTGETIRLHNLDKVEKVHLVTALDIYEDDEAEVLLCYNRTSISICLASDAVVAGDTSCGTRAEPRRERVNSIHQSRRIEFTQIDFSRLPVLV